MDFVSLKITQVIIQFPVIAVEKLEFLTDKIVKKEDKWQNNIF